MNTKKCGVTKDAELTNLMLDAIRKRTARWRAANPTLSRVPAEISFWALKRDTQAIELYGAGSVLKCLRALEKLAVIHISRDGGLIESVWLNR